MGRITVIVGLLLVLSLTRSALADLHTDTGGALDDNALKALKIKNIPGLKLKGKDLQSPHLDRKEATVHVTGNKGGFTVADENKLKPYANITKVVAVKRPNKPNKRKRNWGKNRRKKLRKHLVAKAAKKNNYTPKNSNRVPVNDQSINKKGDGKFSQTTRTKPGKKITKAGATKLPKKAKKKRANWRKLGRKRLQQYFAKAPWKKNLKRKTGKGIQADEQSLNKKGRWKFPQRRGFPKWRRRARKKSKNKLVPKTDKKQTRNLTRKGQSPLKSKTANKRKRFRQKLRQALAQRVKIRKLMRQRNKARGTKNQNMLNNFKGRIRALKRTQKKKWQRKGKASRGKTKGLKRKGNRGKLNVKGKGKQKTGKGKEMPEKTSKVTVVKNNAVKKDNVSKKSKPV